MWKCIRKAVTCGHVDPAGRWHWPPDELDPGQWLLKIDGSWVVAMAPPDCPSVVDVLQAMQRVWVSSEDVLEQGAHEWLYYQGTECRPGGSFDTLHLWQ